MAIWHMVVNADDTICAVYGRALRCEAVTMAVRLVQTTGCAARVESLDCDTRPRTGDGYKRRMGRLVRCDCGWSKLLDVERAVSLHADGCALRSLDG